jgi:glyoxylate utilization-related uncharacterized protein
MTISSRPNNSKGFQVNNYGSPSAWDRLETPHPKFGTIPGKRFLGDEMGLTGMEASLNSLAPGKAIPFLHGHHQNEELYLFLSGKGQMLLDEQVVEVGAGTAIRVAPKVLRSWRNTGTEPLTCVVVQAKDGSLLQATAADGFIGKDPPAWPAAS